MAQAATSEPDGFNLDGLTVRVVDTAEVWPTLRIAHAVPLGRLEWLWNSRGTCVKDSSTSAKAVFEVTDSPLLSEPMGVPLAHQWFRKAYVHILVTTIEELNSGRSKNAWSRVRTFVDSCRERLHEYIIILVADEGEVRQHGKLIDKLRADVNLTARGRERVVTVPPAAIREEQRPISHLHHSPSHQDLLVRLRECVRDGVEARVQAYEGEVSRMYTNRTTPSWSFTSFFALKEGMSFVFVQLGRRDLALKFYDELYVTMTERNERGSGRFCIGTAYEAAIGVTNTDAKDYRRLILDKKVTELDFRTYLFARQVSLLLTDRKYSEVAERGLKFITSIARRCAEEAVRDGSSTSAVFRDAWVFSASRALAAMLAPAVPSHTDPTHSLSAQLTTPRERHTARLIAGFHVHALKAFLGLAHLTLPGCLAPGQRASSPKQLEIADAARNASNEVLRKALNSVSEAELLHSEIANAAASLYEMGGRARGAAALDGDAGVVRLRNGSLSEAEKLLSAQCSRFTDDHGWDHLHRRRRVELARAEKELDRVQEYLVSCLTMLYMTRSVRRLGIPGSTPATELEHYTIEAKYWGEEAVQVASRLPRVMKYKAERLVDVTVLPNTNVWFEGDEGNATVRIVSDIPTALHVDSVMVECRWDGSFEASGRAMPSALHQRNRESGTFEYTAAATSPSGSVWLSPETSPAGSGGGFTMQEPPDMLTLTCESPLELNCGVVDVIVSASEIPYPGRYNVSLVALFIGKLKLVQTALRPQSAAIVTTKGATSNKHTTSGAGGAPSAHAEIGKVEVRFPCFFSKARQPSACLSIDRNDSLFLVQNSVQYVTVRVSAAEHGVASGARIKFSLLGPDGLPFQSKDCFLQLVGASDAALQGGDETTSDGEKSLETFQVMFNSADGHPTDSGEAIISEELAPGVVYSARVAMQVRPEMSHPTERVLDDDVDKRTCTLHVALACKERQGRTVRIFQCDSQSQLSFVSPIDVTARVELCPGWEIPNSTSTIALSGALFSDGGTLLCCVRSRVPKGRSMKLRKASLALPKWLEPTQGEAPPHDALLPCNLGECGTFVLAFDAFVRVDELLETTRSEAKRAGEPLDSLSRRLSRAPDALQDPPHRTEVSDRDDDDEDDFTDREIGSQHTTNGLDQVSRGAQQRTGFEDGQSVADSETLPQERDETSPEHEAYLAGLSLDTLLVDSPDRSASGTRSVPQGLDISLINMGESEDAEDFVDLSSSDMQPSQVPHGGSHSGTPALPGGTVATLRLSLEIDGIGGANTTLERFISVEALKPQSRRYRIDRSCVGGGAVGEAIVLHFLLGAITMPFPNSAESDGVEVLQYEVDADPTHWLVVGRRRGQIFISSGDGEIGRASIVPLTSGRLRVPSIRLYTQNGRALPLSKFDNLNESMHVNVLPCGKVISTCKQLPLPPGLGTDTNRSAAVDPFGVSPRPVVSAVMPAVIASDSFFGSS